ncbi:hypothetical protein BDN72DRAFT_116228 [Pluteus cervinus]|uniref:Uncharacterized protein n=1 Tax=Pluteus cervinus TaxID=181527 RepID=A0ACD3ANZ0_9AGAR|nr:hypothetical protein BDN72DRAFT_116228 [Pluteus cervinus]
MRLTPISLSDLPAEMIESIISEIPRTRDLVQLACTCSFFRDLIIPRHTEYRVLRLPDTTAGQFDYLWSHLSQRPNLTRNMRKVHVSASDITDIGWGALFPKTLVEKDHQLNSLNEREEIILSALRLMFLRFLFNTLSVMPSMKRLNLVIVTPTTHRPYPDEFAVESRHTPSLRHLRLGGKYWATSPLVLLTRDWLLTLTSLRSLRLNPTLVPQCDKLSFPTLRKLRVSPCTSSPVLIEFLVRHNKIEVLDWSSTGTMTLPSGILPNLQSIRCDFEFLKAMNVADVQDGGSPLNRSIERLVLEDTYWPDLEDVPLCNSTCLDNTKLCYLALGYIKDTNSLKTLASSFPMIKELKIRGIILPFDREELYSIIQLFTHLEVFQSSVIWEGLPIEDYQEELEERVRNLASLLPNLRQLNYLGRTNKQIIIVREEPVTFRVEEMEYSMFRDL